MCRCKCGNPYVYIAYVKPQVNVNIPGYKYAIVNAVIHTFTYRMQKNMLMLIVPNINTPM